MFPEATDQTQTPEAPPETADAPTEALPAPDPAPEAAAEVVPFPPAESAAAEPAPPAGPPTIAAQAMALTCAYCLTARAKLRELAATHRARLDAFAAGYRDRHVVRTPTEPRDLMAFFREVLPRLLLSHRYASLSAAAEGVPADLPEIGEALRSVAAAWLGPDLANRTLGALKGYLREQLRADLGDVERQLSRFETPLPASIDASSFSAPPTFGGWMSRVDHVLAEASGLLQRKQDLVDRIAKLAPGGTPSHEAAARQVSEAVELAGGREALAARVREASLVRGAWFTAGPGAAELADAAAALARIDASLKAIGDADPQPGSHAAELRSARDSAAALVERLKAEVDASRRADVAAMIDAACAGDKAARETLLSEVRSRPAAFAPDLVEGLDFTHPRDEPMDQLAAELVHGVPRHEWEPVPIA